MVRTTLLVAIIFAGSLQLQASAGEGRLCQEGGEFVMQGKFQRIEHISGLNLAGNRQLEQVELLYRNSGDTSPVLARLVIEGRDPVLAAPDRLVIGVNGQAHLDDILHLFEAGKDGASGQPLLVRDLGGGTWLVVITTGSQAPPNFDGPEKAIYAKAPALSWVSVLKRRLESVAEAPGGLVLRSASIDRLISLGASLALPPVVAPSEPPICLARQGAVGLKGTKPQLWWLNPAAVAVVDSGIAQHSDLNKVLWKDAVDSSGLTATVFGTANLQACQVACDVGGHGTEVAGAIASNDFGVAPNTPLVPIRIFGDDGCAFSSSIIAGLQQVSKKTSIAVLAWTFSAADDPHCSGATVRPEKVDEMCEAIRRSPDVLFIAAAGNEFQDLVSHSFYPAAWAKEVPNLLVVGGVKRDDSWDSNTGTGAIDLAGIADRCRTITLGNNNEFVDGGTSLAAGFVAGAAALYWAQNPKVKVNDVKNALSKSARLYGSHTYLQCC